MNKLRVIGSTADLDSLVLAAKTSKSRKGTHVLPIDEKLFRVLEDVVRGRRAKEKGPQPAKRPPSDPKLAPREVQRLLRAGRPVDAVAKAAGMDVAWVERFLGPVLDERDVAIQDFRRARLEKPRLGVSGVPVGDAVVRNLRARRVRMSEDEVARAWDASRLEAQPWVISLTFPYRGREQRALWRFDPRSGDVAAANRLGSDLGWVADGRRGQARVSSTAARAKPKRTASRAKTKRPASRAKTKRPASRAKPKRTASRAKPKRTASRRVAATPRRRTASKSRRPAPKKRTATRTSARRRTRR